MDIQKIFTKLRNAINDREDELLNEVDSTFNKLYFNDKIIKDSEKLPNKIKISLERGKLINENWNNNKLNSLINDCLNIENNINFIDKIKNIVNANKSFDTELIFYTNEDKMNQLLEAIKKFGIFKIKKYLIQKLILMRN